MPAPGLKLWVSACALLLLAVGVNCQSNETPQLTQTAVQSETVTVPNTNMDTPVIQVTVAEEANTPLASTIMDTVAAPPPTPPQIQVLQMQVNADDMDELMALHEEIDKQAGMTSSDTAAPATETRTGRSLSERQKLKAAADALTDEEINDIVQMISFPPDERDAITEDKEAYASMRADETKPEQREGGDLDIEPRSPAPANGRARRDGRDSRGYYIIAFSPLEGPLVPYTKLDIIPAERSLEGDMALRRATRKYADATAEDASAYDDDELLMSGSDTDESRMLSMKKLNKYIRRMMRQIRKGTRKIQRKTHFKTHASEPTVENFLRKLYQQRQQQKKQPSSWFSW